jgi:hypothetical protein
MTGKVIVRRNRPGHGQAEMGVNVHPTRENQFAPGIYYFTIVRSREIGANLDDAFIIHQDIRLERFCCGNQRAGFNQ